MRNHGLLIVFISGCIVLLTTLFIGFTSWGKFAHWEVVIQILMGALVVAVLFLAVMAFLSKGKDRWIAFILVSALLLGFSVLSLFSIGLMVAPLALFLLVFSLLKLRRGKRERVTS